VCQNIRDTVTLRLKWIKGEFLSLVFNEIKIKQCSHDTDVFNHILKLNSVLKNRASFICSTVLNEYI